VTASFLNRRVFKDQRVIAGIFIALCLCAFFWGSSRYPSLQGKADAGALSALETPLGFERHFAPAEADHLPARVAATALEWLYTNREGMAFGLLFAAIVVTLLPLFPADNDGRFSSVFKGALLGAPLGVCANCAAPVGVSMMGPGRSPATGLSLIISSPSFNIIILGMLWAQFAWYLVAIKMLSVFFLLFVAVPLVVRFSSSGGRLPLPSDSALSKNTLSRVLSLDPAPADSQSGGWRGGMGAAFYWFAGRFLRNLAVVAIRFVPLMLLAGLLGALIVELFPWSHFGAALGGLGLLEKALMLGGVSLMGAFLPVPIAFDIVICAALLAAGAPDYIVGALLVTLGVFSVYPWMLVGRNLSWRAANMLMLGVIAVGVVGGFAGHKAGAWHGHQQQLRLFEILAQSGSVSATVASVPVPASKGLSEIAGLPACSTIDSGGASARLVHCPDTQPANPGADHAFTVTDASSVGLSVPPASADALMQISASYFGGIASGDINQDGWPDLAVAGTSGVRVFMNIGGRFEPVSLAWKGEQRAAGAVALVDLNNDRLPELVIGTSGAGLKIFLNDEGRFSADRSMQLLPDYEGFIHALAFADIDADGFLDIVVGTAWGADRPAAQINNKNYLAYNRGEHFELVALPGLGGETLSLLLHDFDGDGWVDLLAGNDFEWPDEAYKNEAGQLRLRASTDPFIRPDSTLTTMSLDVAAREASNEMLLYSAQIAFGAMSARWTSDSSQAEVADHCSIYGRAEISAACRRNIAIATMTLQARRSKNFSYCSDLGADAIWCALGAWDQIILPSCDDIPADFAPIAHRACLLRRAAGYGNTAFSNSLLSDYLPQRRNYNALYRYSPVGATAVDGAAGASIGGWSWNSRFTDLDADGFQDILIAGGAWMDPSSWSGWRYYRGAEQGFELAPEPLAGVDLPMIAWVAADFDRDGDRDIVALPALLSPLLYNNEASRGQSAEIALDMGCGVRSGVGTKVSAFVQGRKMSRWVGASGGYASHGGQSVHFGLAQASHIDSLVLEIPGREPVVIDAPIPPGRTTVYMDNCAASELAAHRQGSGPRRLNSGAAP